MSYQVSESVRNHKGAPWVNIYITDKYLMVIPVSKRWHHVTSIVLAVLFGLTFIGYVRDNHEAGDTVALLFFLLIASVAFGYLYKAIKVRRLRQMSITEISQQPGFATTFDHVKIDGSTVRVGDKTLELKDKDTLSLANFLKKGTH